MLAPAVEEAGPEPPPCERHFGRDRIHLHPRYPSGHCVECGASAHEGCRYKKYDDEGREIEVEA